MPDFFQLRTQPYPSLAMPHCQGFLSLYRLEHNNLRAASWLESPACTHAQILYLNSTNQQPRSNFNLKWTKLLQQKIPEQTGNCNQQNSRSHSNCLPLKQQHQAAQRLTKTKHGGVLTWNLDTDDDDFCKGLIQ